jgi:hypothetical protein
LTGLGSKTHETLGVGARGLAKERHGTSGLAKQKQEGSGDDDDERCCCGDGEKRKKRKKSLAT